MAIETANFISDLDPTNPAGADQRSTADDHIRLCKQVWVNSFPKVSAEVSASAGALNFMVGVTDFVQDQLDGKLELSATAASADTWGNSVKYIQTTTPTVATNGLWFKEVT